MKRLILLFALLLPLGLSAQNTWAVKTNVLGTENGGAKLVFDKAAMTTLKA